MKKTRSVASSPLFEHLLGELRFKLNDDLKIRLDPLNEKLDWIIGAYKKQSEEQTLLGNKVTDHDEKIERLETKTGIPFTT